MNKTQANALKTIMESVLENQDALANPEEPLANFCRVQIMEPRTNTFTVRVQKLVKGKGDLCSWQTVHNMWNLHEASGALKLAE